MTGEIDQHHPATEARQRPEQRRKRIGVAGKAMHQQHRRTAPSAGLFIKVKPSRAELHRPRSRTARAVEQMRSGVKAGERQQHAEGYNLIGEMKAPRHPRLVL